MMQSDVLSHDLANYTNNILVTTVIKLKNVRIFIKSTAMKHVFWSFQLHEYHYQNMIFGIIVIQNNSLIILI